MLSDIRGLFYENLEVVGPRISSGPAVSSRTWSSLLSRHHPQDFGSFCHLALTPPISINRWKDKWICCDCLRSFAIEPLTKTRLINKKQEEEEETGRNKKKKNEEEEERGNGLKVGF